LLLLPRLEYGLEAPLDISLRDGGLKVRELLRFSAGGLCIVPRCGAAILDGPEERLLGGVNGRKPPRFSAGAFCIVPRCCAPILDGADERLLGGLKERVLPRLSFRIPGRFIPGRFIPGWFIPGWLVPARLLKLFICRDAGTPALGRILLLP
jgi:hypothetical protein